MRVLQIGQQLRAYRMASGLGPEEIAARLGISRAALYRYEKSGVIKLDTVKRLADLLDVSPLSLLGIGVEYYSRPAGYFERIRQIEETADQILQAYGPACYLTTSAAFDAALADAFDEAVEHAGADRAAARTTADQVLSLLAARKQSYLRRRPGIIAILSAGSIRIFLEQGMPGGLALSEPLRAHCRKVAAAEVEHIADMMESEPMGLQFGLMPAADSAGSFTLLRARNQAMLSINPFRADSHLTIPAGVAMITGADEAIAAHQRVAEGLWRDALKGAAAAAQVREIKARLPRPARKQASRG